MDDLEILHLDAGIVSGCCTMYNSTHQMCNTWQTGQGIILRTLTKCHCMVAEATFYLLQSPHDREFSFNKSSAVEICSTKSPLWKSERVVSIVVNSVKLYFVCQCGNQCGIYRLATIEYQLYGMAGLNFDMRDDYQFQQFLQGKVYWLITEKLPNPARSVHITACRSNYYSLQTSS